jgi:hypothetical protein
MVYFFCKLVEVWSPTIDYFRWWNIKIRWCTEILYQSFSCRKLNYLYFAREKENHLCTSWLRLEKYCFLVTALWARMISCSRKGGVCHNISNYLRQLTRNEKKKKKKNSWVRQKTILRWWYLLYFMLNLIDINARIVWFLLVFAISTLFNSKHFHM